MREISGGCLCGKVRYSATADPGVIAVCHCKNCQRQSGTAFSTIVGVPREALSVMGALKTYDDVSETGNAMHRRFCPECGSRIATDAAAFPSLTFVQVGTLDDTNWVEPTVQFWCASALHWVSLPDKVQQFQKMPG
jgi:hypothetical protein